MCTIMASTGNTIGPEEFETAFARTKYRGPDDTRIEENKKGRRNEQRKTTKTGKQGLK